MKIGMRSPAAIDALYGSEVKYGYDEKIHRFRYAVEGERLTYTEIRERVDPVIGDATLRYRLTSRVANTWGMLRAPINTAAPGKREAGREKAKQTKQRRRVYAKLQAEARRCKLEAAKAGHKDL